MRAAVFDAAYGQPAIRRVPLTIRELEAARCGLGCMGVIHANCRRDPDPLKSRPETLPAGGWDATVSICTKDAITPIGKPLE
jgi:hypothetical protein